MLQAIHSFLTTLAVHICRQRRSIVSTEEFEADKDSLRRMLVDFQHDNTRVGLRPFVPLE